MTPVIGIVVCGFAGNRQYVTDTYISAVCRAGGCPLVLPCVGGRDNDLLQTMAACCHGFLFCGGGDITPALLHRPPLSPAGETDMKTDVFQISLLKHVLPLARPVLAICRGMQILNVACGGTLWQDLSLAPGKTLDHMQKTASRCRAAHRVRTERGSLVRQCFGPLFGVNSFHHQAINMPGAGVHVSARAQDGTVEAVELEGYPFAVGVQWHPEFMYRTSPETRMLFREFVKKV